jgi:SSS family solute:Na+ symporter
MIAVPAGFIANLLTWKFLPGVSWLWWNVSGCVVTFGVGYAVSRLNPCAWMPADLDALVLHRDEGAFFKYRRNWRRYRLALALYFLAMIGVLLAIQHGATQRRAESSRGSASVIPKEIQG